MADTDVHSEMGDHGNSLVSILGTPIRVSGVLGMSNVLRIALETQTQDT